MEDHCETGFILVFWWSPNSSPPTDPSRDFAQFIDRVFIGPTVTYWGRRLIVRHDQSSKKYQKSYFCYDREADFHLFCESIICNWADGGFCVNFLPGTEREGGTGVNSVINGNRYRKISRTFNCKIANHRIIQNINAVKATCSVLFNKTLTTTAQLQFAPGLRARSF